MRLVKALVGGMIGALIGAALIIGVEGFMLKEAPWLALVVGVLTGLGVRLMGKTDKPGPCYLCGAIAAALTLAAFVGATLATTKMLQAQVEKSEIKHSRDSVTIEEKVTELAEPVEAKGEAVPPSEEPAAEEPAAEAPATDETAEEGPAADEPAALPPTSEEEPATEAEAVEEEMAVEESEPAESIVPRVVDPGKPALHQQEFSVWSFVLIGVGALIAYELGRSCGCGKATA